MPTYCNPVYPGYFADPYVLQVDGRYYAYGTGDPADGGAFDVLTSEDLVTWTAAGTALEPVAGSDARDYWAPEVAAAHGRFWMYYSAGVGDEGHHIRLAIADTPQGPFRDTGEPVSDPAAFAIDASPFQAPDGEWWLFYATDRLDGGRPGTVIVVDRLIDMRRVTGAPKLVVRPTADWQRYERGRSIHGGVFDWHTTEGPFVRRHDGRYWCFYSGGNWRSADYGVSVAVADAPGGPWVDPPAQHATVLRTAAGHVLGPGHNCVVSGPNGADWIIYHAWDPQHSGRRMCIDQLTWTAEGPRCAGPTWTPQSLPALP